MFDFSFLKNNENLLFVLIIFSVAVVVLGILVFVIASVIKSIKNLFLEIFRKSEDFEDIKKVENLEIVVPELKKSIDERRKIEEKQRKFGEA